MQNQIANKVTGTNINLFVGITATANPVMRMNPKVMNTGVVAKRSVSHNPTFRSSKARMFAAMNNGQNQAEPLKLNSINAANSINLPMNTLNQNGPAGMFGNSTGFGDGTTPLSFSGASPAPAVPRSDVQRYALQNQLKAMYDTPFMPQETLLGQKLFNNTFKAPELHFAEKKQPKYISQSKAFLQDFLADIGDLGNDIHNTLGPKDFSMNEISISKINEGHMDEQFAATVGAAVTTSKVAPK